MTSMSISHPKTQFALLLLLYGSTTVFVGELILALSLKELSLIPFAGMAASLVVAWVVQRVLSPKQVQAPPRDRGWFTFRLRTLFVVFALMSATFARYTSEQEWVRQRADLLSQEPHVGLEYIIAKPPFSLFFHVRGHSPLYWNKQLPYSRDEARRLFPEAKFIDVP